MAALHFETLALHAGHTVDDTTLSRGCADLPNQFVPF